MRFYPIQEPSGDCEILLSFLPSDVPFSFASPALQADYEKCFADDTLTLSPGEVLSFRLPSGGHVCTVLAACFDIGSFDPLEAFRKLCAKTAQTLSGLKGTRVLVDGLSRLPLNDPGEVLRQFSSVFPLCEYSFSRYHSDAQEREEHELYVLVPEEPVWQKAVPFLEEGQSLAESICVTRDLVNDTAESLTPEAFAETCVQLGAQYGFEVEVLRRDECRELGMNLFLAVARGSALEPCLIRMSWNGASEEEAPLGLVGKGITYDSGGLAIKTSGMDSMRMDMNGGAAVVGAMCAIARNKLPVNVVGVIAACENMVDALSFRNGDIYTSMNGKTVYIRNTDAEGRLTMADAMTYCIRTFHPSALIEAAGLTGSVCNFYGRYCAAALATRDFPYDSLEALTHVTGEKIARMPDFEEYRALLKHPLADLNNSPEGGMGGILAGMFLEAFHEDTPFLHLDLGATPFTKSTWDCQSAGATGFGVKTLYYYAKYCHRG